MERLISEGEVVNTIGFSNTIKFHSIVEDVFSFVTVKPIYVEGVLYNACVEFYIDEDLVFYGYDAFNESLLSYEIKSFTVKSDENEFLLYEKSRT